MKCRQNKQRNNVTSEQTSKNKIHKQQTTTSFDLILYDSFGINSSAQFMYYY